MHPEQETPAGPPPTHESGQGGPPNYGPSQGYAPPPGYGQPGYGQTHLGQAAHVQSPTFPQPPYGQPPHGQPPYGQPVYGQLPYGQPGYPPPGYGNPAYGGPYGYVPAPWNRSLPGPRWPHGPGRPAAATVAAVLGFVTAGLTLAMQIVFIAALSDGSGDASTAVLLLGIPCAAGLIVGSVQLLGRRTHQTLLTSAIASVVVLVLALVVGLAMSITPQGAVAEIVIIVLAATLPITTAVLTAQRSVSGWSNALP